MKKVLLFAGVIFLSTAVLTSCGSKDEKKDGDKKEEKKDDAEAEESEESEETASGAWAPAFQESYMNSCVGTASASMDEAIAKEYCQCTLDKIMAKYPNPADMGQVTQDDMTQLAAECMTADMMEAAAQ